MNIIIAEIKNICGTNFVYYDNYNHRIIYRSKRNLLLDKRGNMYLCILYNGIKTRSITFIDLISVISNDIFNLMDTVLYTKPTVCYKCKSIWFTLGDKYHLIPAESIFNINKTAAPTINQMILKDELEIIKLLWALRQLPICRDLRFKIMAHYLI